MVHRIQRIGVLQLAKVLGVLYFLMGLVLAAIVYMFSFARSGSEGGMFSGFAGGSGMGFILVMPVMYAVLGVVFGALGAWLYNIVAGPVGGIEIDLVATVPSAPLNTL